MSKTDNKQRFKFTMPILKTRVKVVKDANGNEVEERYIFGKASDTGEDLVGDIMAKSAIKSMADSLQQHIIELNAEHDTSWRSELGEVVQLSVDDSNNLNFEGKLNDMSTAEDLWKALTKYNKELGVSIGGFVKDYELEKNTDGEWVRVYKDIELDHIAVTSSPANPRTWVNAIAKSLKESSEAVKELNSLETKKGELSREEIESKVTKLLKSLNREDIQDDIINLIFKSEDDMAKDKTSLEAEEVKKDQTEVTESDSEDVENSAAPDNGKTQEPDSEETKTDDTQAESEEETATDESEEDKSEEDNSEADTEEQPEEEETETEETEEKPTDEPKPASQDAEESSEEGDSEEGKEETEKSLSSAYTLVEVADYLDWAIKVMEYNDKDTGSLKDALETIKGVAAEELLEPEEETDKSIEEEKTDVEKSTKGVEDAETDEEVTKALEEFAETLTKKYREEIDTLKAQINELQESPSSRKGVEVTKGMGAEADGEDPEADKEEVIKKAEAEIEAIRKSTIHDDTKFAQIQEIRRKYNNEYGLDI